MNKIERGPVPSKTFNRLIRYIFDDPETVEEDYIDHDECRVVYVAELRGQDLHDLHQYLMQDGMDLGALFGTPLLDMDGYWMMETTRSNSNGTYWDQVTEIRKSHEVTETVTVTKWKPLKDATKSSEESVPARPVGKK